MQKLYYGDIYNDNGNFADLRDGVAAAMQNMDPENPDVERFAKDLAGYLQRVGRYLNVDESKLS